MPWLSTGFEYSLYLTDLKWPTNCKRGRDMPLRETVVFLGDFSDTRVPLEALAAKFGWAMESILCQSELSALHTTRDVVAVFFRHPAAGMNWQSALETVLNAAPAAAAVVCHRFAEKVSWPEMANAGAFLPLALPFHPDEVRQILGFIADAVDRRHRQKKQRCLPELPPGFKIARAHAA